jgi:hypothetical protein
MGSFNGQRLATFASSGFDHSSATFGGHPSPKPMTTGPTTTFRLVSSLRHKRFTSTPFDKLQTMDKKLYLYADELAKNPWLDVFFFTN